MDRDKIEFEEMKEMDLIELAKNMNVKRYQYNGFIIYSVDMLIDNPYEIMKYGVPKICEQIHTVMYRLQTWEQYNMDIHVYTGGQMMYKWSGRAVYDEYHSDMTERILKDAIERACVEAVELKTGKKIKVRS